VLSTEKINPNVKAKNYLRNKVLDVHDRFRLLDQHCKQIARGLLKSVKLKKVKKKTTTGQGE